MYYVIKPKFFDTYQNLHKNGQNRKSVQIYVQIGEKYTLTVWFSIASPSQSYLPKTKKVVKFSRERLYTKNWRIAAILVKKVQCTSSSFLHDIKQSNLYTAPKTKHTTQSKFLRFQSKMPKFFPISKKIRGTKKSDFEILFSVRQRISKSESECREQNEPINIAEIIPIVCLHCSVINTRIIVRILCGYEWIRRFGVQIHLL